MFTRSAVFDFFAESCRQDEEIFLARVVVRADDAALSREGWADLELDVLDELRWWELGALQRVAEEVFPEGLVDLVRGLLPRWDGVTRHL